MSRLPLKEVKPGMSCRNIYLLKSHSMKLTKTGKKYLDLVIMDSDGELPCKWWDVPDFITPESLIDADFIAVDFTAEDYNGAPQGKVNALRTLTEADVFDKTELVPSSERKPEEMFNELYSEALSFKNNDLKRMVCLILDKNKDKLMSMPGAKSMHHDFLGGLLQHTCEVLETAKELAKIYPCHKELLYAGAIVHDVAKIVEFDQGPTGLVGDYTSRGKLIGHVTLGMSYIESICQQLDINGEIKYLMQHMVLSHHGKPEFGSPVRPMFIEAMLLHESDVLSAKAFEFNRAIEDIEPGTWSNKVFGLENVQVYKFKSDTFPELNDGTEELLSSEDPLI